MNKTKSGIFWKNDSIKTLRPRLADYKPTFFLEN